MKTLSYVSSLHQITEPALLVQQLMVPHPSNVWDPTHNLLDNSKRTKGLGHFSNPVLCSTQLVLYAPDACTLLLLLFFVVNHGPVNSNTLHDLFSTGPSISPESAPSPVAFHGLSKCWALAALHYPFMPSKPVPRG